MQVYGVLKTPRTSLGAWSSDSDISRSALNPKPKTFNPKPRACAGALGERSRASRLTFGQGLYMSATLDSLELQGNGEALMLDDKFARCVLLSSHFFCNCSPQMSDKQAVQLSTISWRILNLKRPLSRQNMALVILMRSPYPHSIYLRRTIKAWNLKSKSWSQTLIFLAQNVNALAYPRLLPYVSFLASV